MNGLDADRLLRMALVEAQRLDWAAELAGEGEAPDFSPGYLRRRDRLLAAPLAWGRRASRPLWRRGLRIAACVALAVAISAGGILAAIPEARARVQRVVFEWFDDHAGLVFDGEGEKDAEGLKQKPTYVPEGFRVTESKEERGIARVVYEDKNEIKITFLCMVMESGKKFTFNNEDSTPQRITVQGEDATLFKANESGKRNRLIWIDEKSGVVYILTSQYDHEELIKMAESIA